MRFTKMQGAGNDYIVLDALKEEVSSPGELARLMCDRHFGIGADGLILALSSGRADFRMRIFNPDGSEAEMCGNGIRCFGKYLYDKGLTRKKELEVETGAGIRRLKLLMEGSQVIGAQVDMGKPILERSQIPMVGPSGKVIADRLQAGDQQFTVTCLSMGNPHCVIFVEELAGYPVGRVGPLVENASVFPHRANVEFVEILGQDRLKARVWERGVGETLACGTGASAAVVAAALNGVAGRYASVALPGGTLEVDWQGESVFLSGPAATVFEGEWLVEQ
jgi:diaminopimelate epimerase